MKVVTKKKAYQIRLKKKSGGFGGNRTPAAGSIIQCSTTEPYSLFHDAVVRDWI